MKTLACVFVYLAAVPGLAQEPILAPADKPTHRFEEVAEGVYFVSGTGEVYTMSNAMVIVGERDCILVDTHVTPAAARALVTALKEVTEKPIRQVIISHYHFDHAHGNQIFGEDVQIIGHEYAREKMLGNVLEESTFLSFTENVPDQIAAMKARIGGITDEHEKARLAERIRVQEAYNEALTEIRPTPPNVTLNRRMKLFKDGREIHLVFLGRAHTGGDVVVFLPEDRLVFTGDLFLPMLSYMGDGFVDEWPQTLEGLKSLDFDLVVPGHGQPFRGKERISQFQAYLNDLWEAAEELHAQGVSVEEAAQRIDMRKHREAYPVFGVGVDVRAVRRIYERIEERKREGIR